MTKHNALSVPGGAVRLFSRAEILAKLRAVWKSVLDQHVDGLGEIVLAPIMDGGLPLVRDSMLILAELRPGLVVLEHPLYISRTRGTDLIDPTVAGESVAVASVENRLCVIMDDLVDGGRTLPLAKQLIEQGRPAGVLTLVVLTKRRSGIDPDYRCFAMDYSDEEAARQWIIGYGMDCDGKYRDLPDIYAVDILPDL